MPALLRAGLRYRLAGGLRQAMRLWGALLVTIAVARGLEVQFPVEQWAADWTHASATTRGLSIATLAIVALLGFTPLLRMALRRWGQQQMQALPLSDGERFTVDFVAVLTFLFPPALALLAVAALGYSTGGALPVTRNLVTLLTTVVAVAAIEVRALDDVLAIRALLLLIAVIVTGIVACPPPLAIASLVAVPLLAWAVVIAAARTPVRVDVSVQTASARTQEAAGASAGPTRIAGFAAGLFARELFWFVRTAGLSQIVTNVAGAWLVVACFILAAANNDVTSAGALARLCGFFAPVAMAIVIAPLIRTRDRNRAARALDATLPVAAAQELGALVAVGLVVALAVDLVVVQRWLVLLTSGRAPAVTAIGASLFPLVAAVDYTLLGEQQSRRKNGSVDGPIFWLAAAFALTAALSPFGALVAASLLVPWLGRRATRAFALHDLPVTPSEALA